MGFIAEDLPIITVISNPVRYKRRYSLYHEFEKNVKDQGCPLLTVEIAFGDRPFEVTNSSNPWHLQLRTWDELWHKENMINLGIIHLSKLMPNWKAFAWVDADIQFARPDWAIETRHQLEHHYIVQMFSKAHDLNPLYEIINTHNGFMYCYINGHKPINKNDYCKGWHPGFAWAARREAIDCVGGLIDWGILGAGDKHMSMGLIGEMEHSISVVKKFNQESISHGYYNLLMKWQEKALKYIRKDVGYVSGSILHYWHGSKAKRRYLDRWKILINNKFDPLIDLKKDCQGLWQLEDMNEERSIKLRDQIRKYFRGRDEDSTDWESDCK